MNSREQISTVSTPSATGYSTGYSTGTAQAAPFYGQSDSSAMGTVGAVDKAKDVSDLTAARATGGHFAGELCSSAFDHTLSLDSLHIAVSQFGLP